MDRHIPYCESCDQHRWPPCHGADLVLGDHCFACGELVAVLELASLVTSLVGGERR